MNSDEPETASPTSPSVPSSTGRRIRVRSLKKQSISQEASLPSIPSDDNDWVSPFTLPPLPALKKNRSQLDRSPEDRHNRSGSSAYYAAAWGSPYATPSPIQSPANRLNRNKNLDLEPSPLVSRKSIARKSSPIYARQGSLPSQELITLKDPQTSPSPSDHDQNSQRRNWLSESEGSGSESDKKIGKTTIQRKYIDQQSAPSSVRNHHTKESVDTTTPETFNGASSVTDQTETQNKPSNMAESNSTSQISALDEVDVKEKPLPRLPIESPERDGGGLPESRPALPHPMQSFKNNRKKVPWKGKQVVIAIPATDRESSGLLPVLSAQERQNLLQKWIDLGYPVHGFNVEDWYASSDRAGGASRATYPDTTEVEVERKNHGPSIHIPDPAEWQAWVEHLREEKLRALGVTPSTSEAPPSTLSPLSSVMSMSRVSSAFPSVVPSPPILTTSATGMHTRMPATSFSPIMGNPNFPSRSQRGTPGLPNGRSMHGYTQSAAFSGMAPSGASPSNYPIARPYSSSMRSPDGQIGGRRAFSPGHVQNMQSMGHILSPLNPSPQGYFPPHSSNPRSEEQIHQQLEATTRQYQQNQAQMAWHLHQRQMSMFPLSRGVSSDQLQQLPHTPKAASPEREPPEIMHPTPRSHRHNLSAALEKGVKDSVEATTRGLSEVVNGNKSDTESKKDKEFEEGEVPEESVQEELPILHRPETLKDIDEKAEIETNPSIAGTPLLLDDKNPFANFKPLPPPEPSAKRPGLGHTAQPSLSKLNVQAKEFSPSRAVCSPQSNVFNFDGNAFASNASSPGKSVASGPRPGHKHSPSSLGLNVAAPVFLPLSVPKSVQETSATDKTAFGLTSQEGTPAKPAFESAASGFSLPAHDQSQEATSDKPSFDPQASAFTFEANEQPQEVTPAKSTFDPRSSTFSFKSAAEKSQEVTPAKSTYDPRSSTFSFGSASFNVEAPEFKPTGILDGLSSTPAKPIDFAAGSIFGDVVIDPQNKPERRNKALPIVKPQSRQGTPEVVPDEKENFGADGRAEVSIDRHKRARTVGIDDEEIAFAESAPFTSLDGDDKKEIDETEVADAAIESIEAVQPAAEASEKASTPAPEASNLDVAVDKETVEVVEEAEEVMAEERAREESTKEQSAQYVIPAELRTDEKDVAQSHNEEPQLEPRKAYVIPAKRDEHDLKSGSPATEQQAETKDKSPETVEEPTEELKKTLDATETVIETIGAAQAKVQEAEADFVAGETQIAKDQVKDEESKEPTIQPPSLSAAAPAFQPSKSPMPSALSSHAQSFEFKPAVAEFVPESKHEPVADQTKKSESEANPSKGGLMASRFAASPPPEPSQMVERSLSSPQPFFSQIKDSSNSEPTVVAPAEPVSSTLENTEQGIEQEKHDVGQAQEVSPLEKYREQDSGSDSVVSRTGDLSYEEINAVMKQFEQDPDLGVIREDTPVKSTPLINMRLPPQFRSDAPSPSPSPNRRLDGPFDAGREGHFGGLGFELSGVHQLNYGNGEISDWNADLSPGQQEKLESRAHFFDDHVNDLVDNVLESRLAPLERALQSIQQSVQQVSVKPRNSRRSLSTENKDSDADDEDDYDAYEGYSHYRSKSPGKRDRRQEKLKAAVLEAVTLAQSSAPAPQVDVNVIKNALQEMRELAAKAAQPQPPTVDLSSIQQALAEIKASAARELPVPVLDTSDLNKTIEELRALIQRRPAEPQVDIQALQASLAEIRQIASERPVFPAVDLSSIQQTLADLRSQAAEKPKGELQTDLKTVLEDVIATHPRLRGSRVESEHDVSQKWQLKIDGLEAMLRSAEKRADGEAALRREAEEELDKLQRSLKDAQDQAALHKEASEEAQKSLEAFVIEKQNYNGIKNELRTLRDQNEALEQTIDEYRSYRETMRVELDAERSRTGSLASSLQDARKHHQDDIDTRDVLREQLARVQQRMTSVMEDVRHDEAEWYKREHDLLSKNQLLQAALDHETNRRARSELEHESLHKEHRENLHFRSKHETSQEEVSRLANIIVRLQNDNKSHQDAAYKAQRELEFIKEHQEATIASQTSRLQDDLDASRSMFQNLQTDSDARISRLQGQLDTSVAELHEQKIKHEQNMERMFENHNSAIRTASEKHVSELDHRLAIHEEKLIDLQKLRKRDVEHAAEDQMRLEHKYAQQLDLSKDKIKHLESKITDLEERLEVTKHAARAAVEAATSQGVNLPTPANSVVASPPYRPSVCSASMTVARGSELPEKISPQALRETIMVLQDQLQNREQKIDKLEAELAAIDKMAPAKVKERDTEIVMLRELLDVRIDDLQELIVTLEKPEYNRTAVKDAVIRLKTQIKMEQQLKERAITGASLAGNMPASISSGIANLASSPRAMVAAAAWGNWRKVRDSGVSAVSDFAANIGSQTPSRSSSDSSSLLQGIMTPPSTNLKTPDDNARPSTARPLAAAVTARKNGSSPPSAGARPLRTFGSQPRTLAVARPLVRHDTNEPRPGSSGSMKRFEPSSIKVEPPSTPLQTAAESDFGDDVDEDASPLDGKDRDFESGELSDLVKSEQSAMKASSPRASRSINEDRSTDVIEVIEER